MLMLHIETGRYKRGQVIKVRSLLSHISPVPIWHYGVVVGYDDVVHFNLADYDTEIRIIRTDLKRFVNGGSRLQVCQMSELNAKFVSREIAERALSQVGSNFGGYNLLTNNCEHFANWCACGETYSNQVPLSEGKDHALTNKVFEKVVAEPTLQTLDNIDHALDKLEEGADRFFEKVDKFIDFIDKLKFPWNR